MHMALSILCFKLACANKYLQNIWAHENGMIIKNKLDSPFFFFSW